MMCRRRRYPLKRTSAARFSIFRSGKPGKTPAHNTNIQYTYNINDNFQSAGSIPRITNFNTDNGQTVLENTSNNISASQAVHLMNDPIIPTVRKSTLNLKSHFLEQHKAMQQPPATNCLVATSNVPVHSGMDTSNKSDDDVDDETNIHFDSMWCNDEYMKLKDIVDTSTPFLPNNSQIFSSKNQNIPILAHLHGGIRHCI